MRKPRPLDFATVNDSLAAQHAAVKALRSAGKLRALPKPRTVKP